MQSQDLESGGVLGSGKFLLYRKDIGGQRIRRLGRPAKGIDSELSVSIWGGGLPMASAETTCLNRFSFIALGEGSTSIVD